MGTMRPTEAAESSFGSAQHSAEQAGLFYGRLPATTENRQKADMELAQAIWELGSGLRHLSQGLRATYILLEEVKALAKG